MRRIFRASPALLLLLSCKSVLAQSQANPLPLGRSIEQDLVSRLKNQPIGQGTLESTGVPDEFIRRVADRIIRMDYQKRYRQVLSADAAASIVSSTGSSDATNDHSKSLAEAPNKKQTIYFVTAAGGLVIIITVIAGRRRKGHP